MVLLREQSNHFQYVTYNDATCWNHWPDLVDSSLWPLTMEYAAYMYNHVPLLESGQAPIDIFGRTVVPCQRLADLHV